MAFCFRLIGWIRIASSAPLPLPISEFPKKLPLTGKRLCGAALEADGTNIQQTETS